MDILKNIYLNFEKILDNNFFKIDLLIILLLLKIVIIFCFKSYNLKIFFNYFKNTIKKTINKTIRKSIFSFSVFFFFNLLISNLIDLLPINLFKKISFNSISFLPTSDINITFSFSIISFIIMIFFSIKKKWFF
ncbi:F0F1 ATP synthase subunit A [Candidatus Carsonella ruddii]|uniref:F0F1 ATP synthase subunit A n=1 Tax=Carsonella ruddii TaxID=114186 RepID=UPI003D814617